MWKKEVWEEKRKEMWKREAWVIYQKSFKNRLITWLFNEWHAPRDYPFISWGREYHDFFSLREKNHDIPYSPWNK